MKIVSFNLDFYIFRLLKILLGAGLLTPLLMSVSFIFPYTVPKSFVFRILVELAAVGYLYLAFKYSSLRPPKTTLFWAVVIFIIINFLAAIGGADFYASFWGGLERMGGVWSLMHFGAWFFMLVGVFKASQEWLNLLKISIGVSSFIALLAIGQHFFSLGDLLPQTDRVYGFFGNPGILAGYLIFNIFLAVYLFFMTQGRTKWLCAFGGLLMLFGLLFTGTRGAYLGLLAGLFIGALWAALFGGKTIKKYSAIFLAAVLILVGFLFLGRNISFIQSSPVLSRAVNFSLSDDTAQSRLVLWQGAWQAWQVKPWLGWGPENFEVAMNKYLSPKFAGFEAYAADRAHNFIFDYGVAVGWAGLLGYASLIGAAGVIIWRRRKEAFIFSMVFISLLAAYGVQNLFIFDSFASYLMLFFVLALVAGHDFVAGEAGKSSSPSKAGAREFRLPFFKQFIFLFTAICLLLFVYGFNFKPLLAANYANRLLSLPAASAAPSAGLLKEVLNLNSFASAEITYQVVLDYIDKISQNPALAQDETFYDEAVKILKLSIERSPGRVRNYIALAWLNLYFSGQGQARISEALALGEKIKDLAPNKKDSYIILVAGEALAGQGDKAQEIIMQAAAIDSKMGEEVKLYYEQLK